MSNSNNSLNEYKARIITVINYINNNLSEKITLKHLSNTACFSPFHFHRIFTSIIGETPIDFLNRVRLEKAANYLVGNPSMTITEISTLCGFSSSTVFSRAFKKHFGVSATGWIKKSRAPYFSKKSKTDSKNREIDGFNNNYFSNVTFNENNLRRSGMKVEIKNLPARHLAYSPQLDGYDEKKISFAWEKLCNWGYSQNLINKETTFIGISFDNPCITPEDKCRYYACLNVSNEIIPPKGFGLIDLPAGKYAVTRFMGKVEELSGAWSDLYGKWMPVSGFEPVDSPCYDIYYETPETNKEGKFVMDLCVPVKSI